MLHKFKYFLAVGDVGAFAEAFACVCAPIEA